MNRNGKVTERNWAEYFEANLQRRLSIDWEKGVQIEAKHSAAIIASLQRFQVGETGEGNHIKKYAALTGDSEYCRAIDLFMAEEGYHAQMLARVLSALDAPLLKGHWSDAAFVVIRRISGLEMELMILMVAELIAKRYYRVLHDATDDANLRLMCVQILRDENAHVAFHCDTLNRVFASQPASKRAWILFWWKRFYQVVCAIVAWDHRGVLRAADCSLDEWMHDTRAVFEQAAEKIFAPQTACAEPQLVLEKRI